MIKAVLTESGLRLSEFSIVPFPINIPELIRYYVPLDAVFFISIYDDWGRQKKAYLEDLGLNVHVLWEVPIEKKGLSGSDIRIAMIYNEQWTQFVPASVAKLIKEWDVIKRLKSISKS
jgi:nicotinamide-nucleotide adenylyltransferase